MSCQVLFSIQASSVLMSVPEIREDLARGTGNSRDSKDPD